MAHTLTIRMPGQVLGGLAARDPDGPVLVTSCAGDPYSTALIAVDLAGEVLWRRTFGGEPGPPRIGDAGTVWVSSRGADGAALCEVDAAGAVLRSVRPEHDPGERLGAFVVLPDGFLVAWLPGGRFTFVAPGRHARVARHDDDGACRWSTPAPLAGAARSRTIDAHAWEPLLVSADRIAATFNDGSSGIAVPHFLDAATGRPMATGEAGPHQHKAIAGPGEFVIGSQGYGIFSTAHHDTSGAVVRRWPTHLMPLVDRHGDIRGPELENVEPSPSRFAALGRGGTVRRGPALSGYYTSYPALDDEGTAVFWRDGRLRTVTADFEQRELFAVEGGEHAVTSRMLLLGEGRLAFALHDELLLVRDTGLGPLDSGPWPCGDGGLRGNPVR